MSRTRALEHSNECGQIRVLLLIQLQSPNDIAEFDRVLDSRQMAIMQAWRRILNAAQHEHVNRPSMRELSSFPLLVTIT